MVGQIRGSEAATYADALDGLHREIERDRVRRILCDPHADLRDRLAKHLAFNTDLTAREAIATLRGAPIDPPVTDDEDDDR